MEHFWKPQEINNKNPATKELHKRSMSKINKAINDTKIESELDINLLLNKTFIEAYQEIEQEKKYKEKIQKNLNDF